MPDVPDRPISADPEFKRLWGDDDHVHAMDDPNDNDTQFKLTWVGMDEYKSFDNGIIADTRQEMDRLVDFWVYEDGLEIMQHRHDGKESDTSADMVPADVIEGNPSGQYFIIERKWIIGVVTEVW
jgi:hypothetical protein